MTEWKPVIVGTCAFCSGAATMNVFTIVGPARQSPGIAVCDDCFSKTLPQPVEVPCELCGKPTLMTGTRRCDRCWELEKRIRADPVLAKKILEKL